MDNTIIQQNESSQEFSMDQNPSTEVLVNMDGVNHLTTLGTSATADTVTIHSLEDQTEWTTIAGENNTLISFRSMPINLDELDPQTQLTIQQNLNADSHNAGQSIITYNPTSQEVVNRLDMLATKGDSEMNMVTNVMSANGNVLNENEAVLLLQHDEGVLPVSSMADTVTQLKDESNNVSSSSVCALIFCQVSATISNDVMERIPDYKSVIWSEIQSEQDVQMEVTETHQCTIYGSMDIIIQLNNKLQDLLNGNNGKCYQVKSTNQVIDSKVQCDILVPYISSRGRLVHQPSRYTGFYKDPVSDQEVDSDDQHIKRRNRRKYYRLPKLETNNEAADIDKVPESIVRPFKFSCNICSFKTIRQSHYQKHVQIHENRNVQLYKCKKCTFVSIRLSHLNRHDLQHSTSVNKCDLCSYSTHQAFYLRRHKRYRHPPSKTFYTCTICNFQTYQRVNFNRHRKLHLPPVAKKTFECECCNYKTDVAARYQRHLTHVHGDSRPYLCDDCGKSFKRTDALKAHKATHMDRKNRVLPHVCQVCFKGFGSKAHLKEHEVSHKKERPFLCHLCGAAFKSQSVQKKHITTIHVNPRSYTCEICNKCFNTRFTLSRHKRTHDNHTAAQVHSQQLSAQHTDNETLEQSQQPLVQDVIGVSMEETFDQSGDIRQTYAIQPNETTTALFYLSENLPM